MDSHGYATVMPVVDNPDMGKRPMLDFPAGYILRAIEEFLQQGTEGPWTIEMDYWADHARLRKGLGGGCRPAVRHRQAGDRGRRSGGHGLSLTAGAGAATA